MKNAKVVTKKAKKNTKRTADNLIEKLLRKDMEVVKGTQMICLTDWWG